MLRPQTDPQECLLLSISQPRLLQDFEEYQSQVYLDTFDDTFQDTQARGVIIWKLSTCKLSHAGGFASHFGIGGVFGLEGAGGDCD